jgi:transposase InsO family protein
MLVSAEEDEMRFTEQMVGQRGAVVRLVQQGLLTEAEAATELGVTARQIRRLVRRVQAAGGSVDVLGYQRQHAAPNRLSGAAREAVAAIAAAHPAWSAPAVWEAVEAELLVPLPSLRTVSRWLGAARPADVSRRPKPARRFEAPQPLDLVQMDTTSGQWLLGGRMAYVIALLDDHSRAILAARAVGADSTVNNLAVLEEAVSRYGPMAVLYSDNGSVFRTTRHGGSRFYSYREAVLAGEVPTQLARALEELGVVLLPHSLGNARAKGKLERWNRFFQERVLADGPYPSVGALDAALQAWLRYYNERHHHRTLGGVPAARLAGYQPRALPAGMRPLADVCALRETRKVAKDHTISLDGVTYTLPREPNLVAFTVELRIRPGQTVRVWHDDQLRAELPHGGAPLTDGLSVDQLLERVLPRLAPKEPRPTAPPRPRGASAPPQAVR